MPKNIDIWRNMFVEAKKVTVYRFRVGDMITLEKIPGIKRFTSSLLIWGKNLELTTKDDEIIESGASFGHEVNYGPDNPASLSKALYLPSCLGISQVVAREKMALLLFE